MARGNITVQTAGAWGGKLEDITWTAADATNENQFTHPGGDVLLLVQNGGAGAQVVEVKGVASPRTFERAEDITITTTNAEVSVCLIPDRGYDQGAGLVHIDVTTDTNLELAVIAMTKTPS